MSASFSVVRYTAELYVFRPSAYVRLYGISGIVVAVFGSRNIWEMQAEVLGSRNDETAMAFRKSVQDESTTSAVAVITPPHIEREHSTYTTARVQLLRRLPLQPCRCRFLAKHIGLLKASGSLVSSRPSWRFITRMLCIEIWVASYCLVRSEAGSEGISLGNRM